MFKKKIISMLLVATIALTQPVLAVEFEDINTSNYKTSIENLSELGVIKGSFGKYNPSEVLTKAECATILQRAFKLVNVPTKQSDDLSLKKEFISTNTSVANLLTAMLPGAKDSISHWGTKEIETLLEARILELNNNGEFNPNSKMTIKEFATAISKAVYGVEKDIDHLSTALESGIIPNDIIISDKYITREEAAYILDSVIGNPDEFKIITMFATSDIHGNLTPYTPSKASFKIGSVSKMNRLINDFRQIQPNILLVDGGDSPYNTNLANFFMGQSTVDVMNAMGYDATVLGNHDFDYKFDNLLNLANRADYSMLSANTVYKNGTQPKEFESYIIKEVDGIKVALVGLTDDGSKLTTHYTNTVDIDFKDHMKVAKEVVAKAEKDSDIVVALAHLHGDNKKLPLEVSGIDIEIGGGNDEFGRPELINDTWVINPGGVAACLNQINLNFYKGEFVGTTFNQIIINDTLPDDTEVKGILDAYLAKMDEAMKEVIGKSEYDLPWSSALVRTQESALANSVADSLKAYMESDIAFINGGGVRAALNKGDVTINNVYSVLPFDNRVVLVEATGQTVWDAIENGLFQYPATAGRFLQASGLKYTFDGAKEPGSRLISVTMDDGTALDLNKTYKVVINDFIAGGGDGFSMFNVLNKSNPLSTTAKLLNETNDYLRDVYAGYIKENKVISPKVEGRITIINPQENDSKLN